MNTHQSYEMASGHSRITVGLSVLKQWKTRCSCSLTTHCEPESSTTQYFQYRQAPSRFYRIFATDKNLAECSYCTLETTLASFSLCSSKPWVCGVLASHSYMFQAKWNQQQSLNTLVQCSQFVFLCNCEGTANTTGRWAFIVLRCRLETKCKYISKAAGMSDVLHDMLHDVWVGIF